MNSNRRSIMIIRQNIHSNPTTFQLVEYKYNHNTQERVTEIVVTESQSYDELDDIRMRYEDRVCFGENNDIHDIYEMLHNPVSIRSLK